MNLPEGFDLQTFTSIDSTNKEAMRKIEAGAGNGLWITATSQTGGRGRGGREWVSGPGNLYCSLIFEVGESVEKSAQLSFVTSLAVRDTIGKFLDIDNIRCKWPNDVLVKDKKISGILLETCSPKANDRNFIIIGIGINITHHPDVTLYQATHINENTEDNFCHADVFYVLSEKMAYWLKIWQNEGFKAIRKSWLESSKGLGDMITVRLPSKELVGRFVDLDSNGALKLDIDGEIKIIHSGDVFF